jgi:hypothetical protein
MENFINFLTSMALEDLLIAFGFSFLVVTFINRILKGIGSVKKIKKQMQELEENKCKGTHNWFDMDVMGSKTHICRDCYWSPKHEGFVKKIFVDAELKRIEFEEKLKKYQEEVLQSVCEEYKIDKDDMNKIYEKLINIKKDFTIKQLEESLKDILGEDSDRI